MHNIGVSKRQLIGHSSALPALQVTHELCCAPDWRANKLKLREDNEWGELEYISEYVPRYKAKSDIGLAIKENTDSTCIFHCISRENNFINM